MKIISRSGATRSRDGLLPDWNIAVIPRAIKAARFGGAGRRSATV